MYIFLPPIFTILVSHSLCSAFKVAEAPSSLLPLGIFHSGMTLNSFVSIQYTMAYLVGLFTLLTSELRFFDDSRFKSLLARCGIDIVISLEATVSNSNGQNRSIDVFQFKLSAQTENHIAWGHMVFQGLNYSHSGPIGCKGSLSTARRCGFEREWFTQVAY